MITYKENIISVKEYNEMYDAVGWGAREEKHVKEALDRTYYSISAYENGEIIGYGRIVGDGTCFLYIQDIMVTPKYQGQKIGSCIMNKLLEKVRKLKETNPYLRVYVGPDYQKESFYRKFGFQTREEAGLGTGMILKDESKIWKVEEELSKEELNEIIEILQNDGVIIFPTDTVYGLACNVLSEKAIQKLFDIKKRDTSKPICVLTDSVEKINKVAIPNEKEKELINKYMPGALTIILKKKENVSNRLTANLDTIGVRIPDHKIALQILKEIDTPLAVTSANESGKKEGINVQDIKAFFAGKIDGIVDGGTTPIQVSSTIIKVENDDIKVLREGTIKIEEK